eukprot:GHUV01021773.1.p1 GENE.GHUV01021773.1~~GHUV01021773.1.p1  ORF type:complete len:103 (+),score=19.78 GHUV01021773.1:441-749(+)
MVRQLPSSNWARTAGLPSTPGHAYLVPQQAATLGSNIRSELAMPCMEQRHEPRFMLFCLLYAQVHQPTPVQHQEPWYCLHCMWAMTSVDVAIACSYELIRIK